MRIVRSLFLALLALTMFAVATLVATTAPTSTEDAGWIYSCRTVRAPSSSNPFGTATECWKVGWQSGGSNYY